MPVLKNSKEVTSIKTFHKDYGTFEALNIKGTHYPYRLISAKNSILFDEENPVITLTGNKANSVSLTKNGFLTDKIYTAYTKKSIEEFVKKLQGDLDLQQSVLHLSRTLWSLPAIHAATNKSTKFGEKFSKAHAEFLLQKIKLPTIDDLKGKNQCKLETVSETVSTTVEKWVNVVTTAVEQSQKCIKNCNEAYWPIDPRRALCYLGCGVAAFEDVITGTIKVLTTITEVVVRHIYVCTPLLATSYLNPFGFIEKLKDQFKGVFPKIGEIRAADFIDKLDQDSIESLKCIIKGKWSITQLKDVNVDVKYVGELPFGLRVCLEQKCALKIRDTLLRDLAVGVPFQLFQMLTVDGEAEKLFEELGLHGQLEDVFRASSALGVVPAGITIGVFAKLVLAGVMLVFYHAILIAGQIAWYEATGQIKKWHLFTPPYSAAVTSSRFGIPNSDSHSCWLCSAHPFSGCCDSTLMCYVKQATLPA